MATCCISYVQLACRYEGDEFKAFLVFAVGLWGLWPEEVGASGHKPEKQWSPTTSSV